MKLQLRLRSEAAAGLQSFTGDQVRRRSKERIKKEFF